ncbi:MAG: hypothetical protein ACOY99_04980 [Pseudomonadota bacterium]
MFRKILLAIAACLGAGALALPAFAEDAAELAREYALEALPGHQAQMEAALKAHADWRKKNGDPFAWSIYQVIVGEAQSIYIVRSSGHKWADFDTYGDSDFAAKASAHYRETVAPHTTGRAVASIWRNEGKVQRWPQDGGSFKYFLVLEYVIKPGHTQRFTDAAAKFSDVANENDWPGSYAMEWLEAGGEGPKAALVIPSANWAGFADPEPSLYSLLVKKHGEAEAARIRDAFTSAIAGQKSFIVVHRPEFSVPAATVP